MGVEAFAEAHRLASVHKKKHGERWHSKVTIDSAMLDALKPDSAVVYKDSSEGRFLLHHKGIPGTRRSVSWTQRGEEEAIRESLNTLWSWECSFSGDDCPIDPEYIGELAIF